MSKQLPLMGKWVANAKQLPSIEQQRDERLRRLRDVVNSIYRQTQDIREIYLYNYNRGIKWQERDSWEHPIDYKLNQLETWLQELRGMVGADVPSGPAPYAPPPRDDSRDEYEVFEVESEHKRLT